jgi:hypothetical protein
MVLPGKHCAMQIFEIIQGLDNLPKPEELEEHLDIKPGSDAGTILVRLSSEAQCK